MTKRNWPIPHGKHVRPIDQGGLLKFVFNKEYHAFNPDVINALHNAVRSGDYSNYQEYADLVNTRPVATIRDLLKLKTDNSIALMKSNLSKRFYRALTRQACL
jgi:glutamate synthase (NADPH/NADH) large chain